MNAQYLGNGNDSYCAAGAKEKKRISGKGGGETRSGLGMVRVAVIAKEMIYAKANSINSF